MFLLASDLSSSRGTFVILIALISREYDSLAYDINKQGQIVFTNAEFCNVATFLLWELMVFSEARSSSASVLDDMEKLRLTEKVFSRLRQSYERDCKDQPFCCQRVAQSLSSMTVDENLDEYVL